MSYAFEPSTSWSSSLLVPAAGDPTDTKFLSDTYFRGLHGFDDPLSWRPTALRGEDARWHVRARSLSPVRDTPNGYHPTSPWGARGLFYSNRNPDAHKIGTDWLGGALDSKNPSYPLKMEYFKFPRKDYGFKTLYGDYKKHMGKVPTSIGSYKKGPLTLKCIFLH